MANLDSIIELYSDLADNPSKDFGWEKGLSNAKAQRYRDEWFEVLPKDIWKYCAAVGNPFLNAEINSGDVVVDLGCGAGVDLLISGLLVGKDGRAIGVDITPKMVKKAKEHANMSGFLHVDAIESSFENIPLEDESVDVVISNGAINLTSCKESVFAEIFRILKPDGKLFFADIIDISKNDELSTCCSVEVAKEESCCASSEEENSWANCVAGTLKQEKLIDIMYKAGFTDIECTGLTDYTTSETTRGATFRAVKNILKQSRQKHWNDVFIEKDYTQVLWHENSPEFSLELIHKYGISHYDAIIDVGCGASLLVDKLIEKGYKNITLLDIAESSLDVVKERLGELGSAVRYICCDVTQFEATNSFSLWHDRAVFHFLLDSNDRKNYFKSMYQALKSGGIAIINTFAIDGPKQCCGLDIIQYDAQKMKEELIDGLELIESIEMQHLTPTNSYQSYSCFIIKATKSI
ncbi:methyltransferase domain-containing protein [Candidatus Sulfurimonas marisnigri]|uniref:Methyltransferase domain-containing protein n=1 Tax=Candidatus Sulfurimonas marisnigri TaxID=2740405 RepID=A0A7S7RPP6_9BACT|nr:class I SAM-dependent methyltransferase [Candidatus Sulfurimonas marisnigri]QOY53743.1 methyltransferase domain-containing protein [Candidatus Sulfurimonas marisnigri]